MRSLVHTAIGAALVAQAAADWAIKNPRFATIALSVDFVDENTGYVPSADNGVGAAELKTSDAGAHWSPCPGADGLMFLAGAAAAKNVVIGGPFVALYSNDEGAHFNASTFDGDAIAASQSLAGCPKDPNFFGMTGEGFASGNGVAISRNGGRNYTFQRVAELRTGARYGAFPTQDTWYLSAGQWPRRPDNGIDVHELSSRFSYDMTSRSMKVSTDALDAASDDDAPTGGWAAQIVRTNDAGKTWETVFWANTTFYFNQISCATEQHCCAVAEGEEGNYIFCTQDGGKDWKITMHTQGRAQSIFSVHALSATEWWAGGGELSSTNFQGVFFHSMNGGQTWNSTSLAGAFPNDLSFPSRHHGFATAFTQDGQSAFLEYTA